MYQNNYDAGKGFFKRSNQKTATTYDLYKEKVLGMTEYNGSTAVKSLKMTYENGSVRSINDGSVKYGIRHSSEDADKSQTVYTQFASPASHDETVIQTEILTQNGAASNYSDTLETVYHRSSTVKDTITVNTDKYGRPVNVLEGTAQKVKYNYATNGNESTGAQLLSNVEDGYEGMTTEYSYDPDGNIVSWVKGYGYLSVQNIGSGDKYTFPNREKYFTNIVYDSSKNIDPRLTSTGVYYDPNTDDDDDLTEIPEYRWNYTYDTYGRLSEKKANNGNPYQKYSYINSDKNLSSLPASYEYKKSESYAYSSGNIRSYGSAVECTESYGYDSRGNIDSVYFIGEQYMFTVYTDNSTSKAVTKSYNSSKTYGYDEANRLVKETDSEAGINRIYNYNSNGRLQSITGTNAKTFEYYGASDGINNGRLKKCGTTSYTYDLYGNRLSKTGVNYSYVRGNLLAGFANILYSYNAAGVRYRKTFGGIQSTTYFLDGDKIIGEDRDNIKLRYFYDIDGLCGISCNGVNYNYVRNAMGDILMITSGTTIVARYQYDAWGKCTVHGTDPIANLNPFRWKGHYFDIESGLYYINGRYYDTDTGLFLNAADISGITDYAGTSSGLDRNGMMCDNILELLPYLYAIYTASELSADPNYDPKAGKPWWELAWMAIVEWFSDVMQWWNDLHWGWKVGIGTFLFAIALVMTIATKGAVLPLFIGMAVSIGFGAVIGGFMSAVNGEGFWEGFFAGAAEGVFWGGVFAFVTASVQTIKYLRNSTVLYRSVGTNELADIKSTKIFRTHPTKGFEGKQFSFSAKEARKFGIEYGQKAIVKTRVPNSVLKTFNVSKNIDPFIFKKGVITVSEDLLKSLNSSMNYIKIIKL